MTSTPQRWAGRHFSSLVEHPSAGGQKARLFLGGGPLCVGCFGLLSANLVFLSACFSGKSVQPVINEAVPVTVATVIQKAVPVQVRTIGTVEAYSTVSVKAQVTGELTSVHFKEGQDVKKGELLFTIDRRSYEADLMQAEANLARDIAQAQDAEAQAHRSEKLMQEGIIAKEQSDRVRANADALQAAVRADRAAVENARLRLSYCSIFSPLDGRTGSLIVHQGNLVKANEAPALVVINQIQPIYVNFSVPEQYLAEIKKYMVAGKLKVEAFLPNDHENPQHGLLTFVDNAVNSATGTIRLKATYANKEKRLWPGQFVDVVLTLTTQPNALVVPSQALQTGQGGQYVFVVKMDLTAEPRPVVVGRTVGGDTVIEQGLQPGERVVTDGQLRLVPGAKVEVKSALESSQGTRL